MTLPDACVEMTSMTGNVKWGRSDEFTIDGVSNAPTVIPTPAPTTVELKGVQKGQFLNKTTYVVENCPAGDYDNGIQGTYQDKEYRHKTYDDYPTECTQCECDITKDHTARCNPRSGHCHCMGTWGTGSGTNRYCKVHQHVLPSYIASFSFAVALFPFAAFIMGRGDLFVTHFRGEKIDWCKQGYCCRLSAHGGFRRFLMNWLWYCCECLLWRVFIPAACSWFFVCESCDHREDVLGHRERCNWLGRKGNRADWAKYTVDYSITRRFRNRIKIGIIEYTRNTMSRRWREERLRRYWNSQIYAHNWKQEVYDEAKKKKKADEVKANAANSSCWWKSTPVNVEMACRIGSLKDAWNIRKRIIIKKEIQWGSWVEISEHHPPGVERESTCVHTSTVADHAATRIEMLQPAREVTQWQLFWKKWGKGVKLVVGFMLFLIGAAASLLLSLIKLAFNVYVSAQLQLARSGNTLAASKFYGNACSF